MRGLAINFASTHQTENPRGFSEVGENQQLLIAIVGNSFYYFFFSFKCILSFNYFVFNFFSKLFGSSNTGSQRTNH
ncbi:hypothetical protein BWZ20_15015 [Winogradskyella sp. J14-2]|nr:hypothetical protein BWZ20_14995 [Winogradskyella sp. J14-2]APY09533.1 hypothetical protein BWZ20_15015 [Winogradskyella sp. J14-2]